MDSALLTTLTSLETALSTLNRSISAYNPSLPTSTTLLAGTSSLSSSLNTLSTHQRNHTHIQTLRSTTTALDVALTTHLSALASLRSEILASPLHGPRPTSSENSEDDVSEISINDLLKYGRVTARYLTPKDYKPPSVRRAEDEARLRAEAEERGETIQDGVVISRPSPVAGSPDSKTPTESVPVSTAPTVAADGEGQEEPQQQEGANVGVQALDEGDRRFIRLDTDHEPGFEPFAGFQMFAKSVLPRWQGSKEEFLKRLEDERMLNEMELGAERKREQERIEAEERARADAAAGRDRPSQRAGPGIPQATAFSGWDDED